MTARAPVYIDSGKLHVFEDGDTLPPWLSPSSMAWESLTGVPAGITQLADLTGPGYAKVDAAGAWSVQAAIPQADVSGLTTALAGLQPISARLTAIAGLTDAAGWLHDDGSGAWSISVPTASQVGAEAALGSPATSGYLLSSTSAGGRSWVAPYSLPTATASVLGGVKIGAGLSIASGVLSVSYGTAAGTACVGNDSRLSDSRAPTAHALDGALHTISGKTAGQVLVATGATTFGFATISGDATLSGAGALTLATLLAAGSAGSATAVPTLTWDAKGRLTAVGSAAISIPHTQISDWGTYINQVLLTTSSPTFSSLLLSMGTSPALGFAPWNGNPTVASFIGSVNNTAASTSNGLLFTSNRMYMLGLTGVDLFVGGVGVVACTSTLTTIATPLTVTGLISANAGIAGNLTGTASNASALGGVAADYFVQGTGYNSSSTYGKRTTSFSYNGATASSTALTDPLYSGFYDGYFTSGQTPNNSWAFVIDTTHSNTASNSKFQFQVAASFDNSLSASFGGENYWMRVINSTGTGAWRTLMHSGNVGSYAIPLTGSSAITGALVSSSAATFANITANSDLHVNGTIYIGGGMIWGLSNTLSIGSASNNIQIDMANDVFTTFMPTTIHATLTANQLYSTGDVVLDGKFRPAVNTQSASYTITSSDQGKIVVSNNQLNLPASGIPTGFWCIVNWHVGGGGVKFGPTTSGTNWYLRGASITTSTSIPFSGIVSWDGYTWYAG